MPANCLRLNRLLYVALCATCGFSAVAVANKDISSSPNREVVFEAIVTRERFAAGRSEKHATEGLDFKTSEAAIVESQSWLHRKLLGPYRPSPDETAAKGNNATSRKRAKRARRMEGETTPPPPLWQGIYMSTVLILMFIALLSERVKPEWVMITTVTVCMLAGLITSKEALVGFSNEGVISIMVLFVVAEGISNTGALDWYMNILLGKPRNIADAQLRVICPIICLSAFMKNTPLVVIMIPIIQRWSHNCGIPPSQLMIPLSFSAILGGTCTLIGTSTNLVVSGLLQDQNPEVAAQINIFSVGVYGVPIALAGATYMIIFTQLLLPGGAQGFSAGDGQVLLGARLTKWSPAAGRTVKRSGLRDTGGIYLVSVLRSTTGNMHRAVGNEFVLNVGDILYFTALVEEFAKFCEDHGLEIVTLDEETVGNAVGETNSEAIGCTKQSLLSADECSRMRCIYRMIDLIKGVPPSDPDSEAIMFAGEIDPAQIVVANDSASDKALAVIGVNCSDRPGLLHDLSMGIVQLQLQCHHTEAKVIGQRSFSVWRCEFLKHVDAEEIWVTLKRILDNAPGNLTAKERGLPVIRATITKHSSLPGRTASGVDFRKVYGAAIVALQRGGANITENISNTVLQVGDVLVLQATNDSPLLVRVEDDFYEKLEAEANLRHSSVRSMVDKVKRSLYQSDNSSSPSGVDAPQAAELEEQDIEEKGNRASQEATWKDLQVAWSSEGETGSREFLAAMKVPPGSSMAGKSARSAGLLNLPGLVLVSIDRPVVQSEFQVISDSASAISVEGARPKSESVPFEEKLCEGDLLWFAGSASSVGDLRKIPGLTSYVSDEVKKMKEEIHERRLVEAVVSKRSPLVGKTPAEVEFRTRYGAAVVAVNREGKRLYEHPGKVKLQAGDVILLEAGPTFVKKHSNTDNSFALVSVVENSTPPRLRMFIPALVITVAMLAVSSSGVASLLLCALVAAILMVLLGIVSQQEALECIGWDIYITVASAFGIAIAMENSGVADAIANFLVGIGTAIGLGDAGLFGAVYFATGLISNVITNNAAAALIYPIAMEAAYQSGADVVLMAYCVMYGASACYMSPFGYQTNLLVFGPGGYKAIDFVKFGTLMQTTTFLTATTVLSLKIAWYWIWIVLGVVFAVTSVIMVTKDSLLLMFKTDRKSHSD